MALVVESAHSGPFFGRSLSEPTALRSAADGSVFLIDRGNQRLLKFDRELGPRAEIGGSGAFRNFFDVPQALALGGSNLYVSDLERDQIHRLDLQLHPQEQLLFEDSLDAFRFGAPVGLALTADEDLWVVDGAQRRVAVFDRYLEFREFLADYNTGGFSLRRPGAALALSENRVALCDGERGALALFDDLGGELGMIGGEALRSPGDLAESPNGLIWVVDSLLDEVVCLDQKGAALFRTSQTGSAFKLLNPSGICAIGADTLLISDSGSGQILVCRVFYSQ